MPGAINHVMITVADLNRSIAFYRDVVGLEVALRTTLSGAGLERMMRATPGRSGEMALLRGEGKVGQVELIQWSEGTGEPRSGSLTAPGTPMLSFEARDDDELARLYAAFSAGGHPVWSEPQDFIIPNYGPTRAFLGEDPDGTVVEFVRLPTREQVKAYLTNAAAAS